LDHAIQKDVKRPYESGDPERIKKAQQEASETYATSSGAMIGGVLGSFICPGLGTWIGAGIGAVIGNKVAKD
jgi:outer membrane lipoprotein SlyB